MEKYVESESHESLLRGDTWRAGRVLKGRRAQPAVSILGVALLALAWTIWSPLVRRNETGGSVKPESGGDDFFVDWDTITPSQDLDWVPCFRVAGPNLLCARLTVPLDYSRPLNESDSHPKAHIALVLVPGQKHGRPGVKWSESPLLLNPGGPGGEGTSLAVMMGSMVQTVVGTDHDVIGFDPRGIGGTIPTADCFLADGGVSPTMEERNQALLRRLTWMIGDRESGLPGVDVTAADRIAQRHRAFSRLCGSRDSEESILRYAGTPHVARDMLSIVEAWDRWTAEDEALAGDTEAATVDADEPETNPPSTRGKLVYWGFSYGTVLGATFASMFPDKVGRMVLDGVVNTDEWFFDNAWVNATMDADKILDQLLVYCHRAGDHCALYRPGDEAADTRARFDSLMDRLRDDPVLVTYKESSMPGMITHSDIQMLLFSVLYQPLMFPVVVRLLDVLYREQDINMLISPLDLAPLCAADFKMLTYPSDGGLAVLCSDQHLPVNHSRPALEDLLGKMQGVSSFADVLFTVTTRCSGWEAQRADPPFIDWDSFPMGGTNPVNTSFPILFVSNTLDPITPRHSGLWQTRNFANSGFVEQLSEGHCSIAFVSLCTVGRVRDYFNKGVVPPPPQFDGDGADLERGDLSGSWTTCPTDEFPWSPLSPTAAGMDAESFRVVRAMKELQREFGRLHRVVEPPRMFEKLFNMDEEEVAELLELARHREAGDSLGAL